MEPEVPQSFTPQLIRLTREGVTWHEDAEQRQRGALVAFTERTGGVSDGHYRSLNLAAHVGDDPEHVASNRRMAMKAMGLSTFSAGLTTAQQVHGDRVVVIGPGDCGAGADPTSGPPPVAHCDALVTTTPRVPLMLLFADCVPVVLVAPGQGVAVAHAGWRGALAGIAGSTARVLAREVGCDPAEIVGYVGPHIGSCHYEVGAEIMSHFVNTFGTVARADSGGLDLGAVVAASLVDAGVSSCSIAALGACTFESTDRFYSYRAENGLTGRHGAVACIL
jgi:YfiH family protein